MMKKGGKVCHQYKYYLSKSLKVYLSKSYLIFNILQVKVEIKVTCTQHSKLYCILFVSGFTVVQWGMWKCTIHLDFISLICL